MIHPDTELYWLDLSDGEPRYKTVDQLWQEYCHKSKNIFDLSANNPIADDNIVELSEIKFDSDCNLKITEIFGFTDLISIRKIKMSKPIFWMNLFTTDNNVIVTLDELIPFYNINDSTIGFHGEVKYKYTLKTPDKLKSNDTIRLRHFKENGLEFENPKLTNYKCDVYYGYQIITKSKFYNANSILLATSDIDGKFNKIQGYK